MKRFFLTLFHVLLILVGTIVSAGVLFFVINFPAKVFTDVVWCNDYYKSTNSFTYCPEGQMRPILLVDLFLIVLVPIFFFISRYYLNKYYFPKYKKFFLSEKILFVSVGALLLLSAVWIFIGFNHIL